VRIWLYPEADREIEKSARWYAAVRPALGHAFLDAVWDALDEIGRHPNRYPVVNGAPSGADLRKCLLSKFPYVVIFEVRGDAVEVLSVSHGARRPGFWKRRRSRRR
jgi:toxin ParE1/3/4